MDCHWPPPPADQSGLENCTAVSHTKYYAEEYYSVRGKDQLMAELQNGPVGCGVHATDNWEKYQGGYIYSEHIRFPLINHEISVVGYGKDSTTGEQYWIGRNSWGTYWGDQGFFYMTMQSGYDLGISSDCVAAKPTYTKPYSNNIVDTILDDIEDIVDEIFT